MKPQLHRNFLCPPVDRGVFVNSCFGPGNRLVPVEHVGFIPRPTAIWVGMADGSVRTLNSGMDPNALGWGGSFKKGNPLTGEF